MMKTCSNLSPAAADDAMLPLYLFRDYGFSLSSQYVRRRAWIPNQAAKMRHQRVEAEVTIFRWYEPGQSDLSSY